MISTKTMKKITTPKCIQKEISMIKTKLSPLVDIVFVLHKDYIADSGAPWDIAEEQLGRDYIDNSFLIVEAYVNNGKISTERPHIRIQHNKIQHKLKKEIHDALYEMFGDNYSWPQKSTTKSMFIKFVK